MQGYIYNDRAYETEDDKAIDVLLKRGTKMIEKLEPETLDWFTLFTGVYTSKDP
jgi:hypothetical protein